MLVLIQAGEPDPGRLLAVVALNGLEQVVGAVDTDLCIQWQQRREKLPVLPTSEPVNLYLPSGRDPARACPYLDEAVDGCRHIPQRFSPPALAEQPFRHIREFVEDKVSRHDLRRSLPGVLRQVGRAAEPPSASQYMTRSDSEQLSQWEGVHLGAARELDAVRCVEYEYEEEQMFLVRKQITAGRNRTHCPGQIIPSHVLDDPLRCRQRCLVVASERGEGHRQRATKGTQPIILEHMAGQVRDPVKFP